jgi:hypothetical protein
MATHFYDAVTIKWQPPICSQEKKKRHQIRISFIFLVIAPYINRLSDKVPKIQVA